MKTIWIVVAALTVWASAASAQGLSVGSDAPALAVAKWVKGEALTLEKGNVYVVEFWATWCGPCITSMPHLSELQEHYGDKLKIIGVTREDPNNGLAAVEQMVKDKGPGMGYTVAWDDEGKTYESFMTASGARGIPTSFVIDQNLKIAHIGHPRSLDLVLKEVVAGSYDPATFQETMNGYNARIRTAMQNARTDPAGTVTAIDALTKDVPELATMLARAREQLLIAAKDWDGYNAQAKVAVDKAIKYRNAPRLNDVAWTIVDPAGKIERKDVDLALRAAEKANEYTHGKDAAILDTVARALSLKGALPRAIELQTKAIAIQKAHVKKLQADSASPEVLGNQKIMLRGLRDALREYKAKTTEKAAG